MTPGIVAQVPSLAHATYVGEPGDPLVTGTQPVHDRAHCGGARLKTAESEFRVRLPSSLRLWLPESDEVRSDLSAAGESEARDALQKLEARVLHGPELRQ
jgi:hypothetical protein